MPILQTSVYIYPYAPKRPFFFSCQSCKRKFPYILAKPFAQLEKRSTSRKKKTRVSLTETLNSVCKSSFAEIEHLLWLFFPPWTEMAFRLSYLPFCFSILASIFSKKKSLGKIRQVGKQSDYQGLMRSAVDLWVPCSSLIPRTPCFLSDVAICQGTAVGVQYSIGVDDNIELPSER